MERFNFEKVEPLHARVMRSTLQTPHFHRYIMKFTLFFTLCATMLTVSPCLTAEATEPNTVEYVWLRRAKQERTRDNGVNTSYELLYSRNDVRLSGAELVIVSTTRPEAGGEVSEVYTKTLSEVDGKHCVDIYSGRYEKIAILAKASVGEKYFYAGTLLSGYGQSGKSDAEATRIDAVPDWPRLLLAGEESFYYAQTGTPLNVRIENGPEVMGIYENNAFIGTMALDNAGFFSYTPPHDKALSQGGNSATKDLVFVVELKDGRGVVSLYLPVHRAYLGQVSLKGGLGVMGASAVLCLVLVLYRSRRFRWR